MKATIGAAMLIIVAVGPWSVRAQSGSEAVTFEELWTYAKEHSPHLVAAKSRRERVQAANAKVKSVLAQNPTLAVQAGPRFQAGYRNYDLNASLSQPVRVAGEGGRERDLAVAATSRIDAEVEAEAIALRLELRAAFRTASAARERTVALTIARESQERVQALVSKQVAAGDATLLDQRLAEVETVQAQQASLAAEQVLSAARLRLADVAGWPMTSPPDPREEPHAIALPSREELIRQALAESPRLNLLQARVRETEAQTKLSDRQRFPEPEIGVVYARQGTTPVSDPVSHTVFATLGFPVPLWFRNQPERAESRAAHVGARAELTSGRQIIAAEVARAHADAEFLAQRVALYESTLLPKFTEHMTLMEKALTYGEISIFNFIAARTRVLQAELEALDVRAAYAEALSRLEQTVGYELGPQKGDAL